MGGSLAGVIAQALGWRFVFVALGVAALVIAWPLGRVARGWPVRPPRHAAPRLAFSAYVAILRHRGPRLLVYAVFVEGLFFYGTLAYTGAFLHERFGLNYLAIGAILLWRYRFPFMLMPIAVTLWYMSMDLVPFLLGKERVYDWEIRKLISLWFGLAMTLVAFWVDLRSRFSRDYAFWLYLFGVLTFWGGLSLMDSGSEWGKLAYCGINVAMILVGAVLGRRVFAVFGGLGVAGYLGYLSHRVFKDSLVFPFALSLVGLAIIALGVLWQRREAQWAASLRRFVPGPLRELIEARR